MMTGLTKDEAWWWRFLRVVSTLFIIAVLLTILGLVAAIFVRVKAC